MADGTTFQEVLVDATEVAVAIGDRPILDGIAVRVDSGRIVTLIGPNGAGKTTMVRVILGLVPPARGRIYRRPGLRVGYVPQRLQLDPTLPITVGRFLDLGLRRGVGRRKARCAQVLEEVGAPRVLEHSLHAVSGGELQRVLLARALFNLARVGAQEIEGMLHYLLGAPAGGRRTHGELQCGGRALGGSRKSQAGTNARDNEESKDGKRWLQAVLATRTRLAGRHGPSIDGS